MHRIYLVKNVHGNELELFNNMPMFEISKIVKHEYTIFGSVVPEKAYMVISETVDRIFLPLKQ